MKILKFILITSIAYAIEKPQQPKPINPEYARQFQELVNTVNQAMEILRLKACSEVSIQWDKCIVNWQNKTAIEKVESKKDAPSSTNPTPNPPSK